MIHYLGHSLNMRLGGLPHFPNRSPANRSSTNRGPLHIGRLVIQELGNTKELIHLLERQTCDTISKVRSIPGPNLPLVSGMKNQTQTNAIKQNTPKKT